MGRLTFKDGRNEYDSVDAIEVLPSDSRENLFRALKKLGEYEDLEEQGMLLKLPCKVGDTVYCVIEDCKGDFYNCNNECDTCCNNCKAISIGAFELNMLNSFNKDIFLTREEAEASLEKAKEQELFALAEDCMKLLFNKSKLQDGDKAKECFLKIKSFLSENGTQE